MEWKPYEVHPDTPLEGWIDPEWDSGAARELDLVRTLLGPDGPPIRLPRLVANSHPALEAAEYARERGQFAAFHRRVFAAYFVDELNIGLPEVLRALGYAAGLDGDDMVAAAGAHRYHDRLEQVRREIRWYGLYGTPTFIVGNRRIAGAQPYATLAHLLDRVGALRRTEAP